MLTVLNMWQNARLPFIQTHTYSMLIWLIVAHIFRGKPRTNSGDFTSSALNFAPQPLCAPDSLWCVLLSLGAVMYGFGFVILIIGVCMEHRELVIWQIFKPMKPRDDNPPSVLNWPRRRHASCNKTSLPLSSPKCWLTSPLLFFW